MLLGKILKDI